MSALRLQNCLIRFTASIERGWKCTCAQACQRRAPRLPCRPAHGLSLQCRRPRPTPWLTLWSTPHLARRPWPSWTGCCECKAFTPGVGRLLSRFHHPIVLRVPSCRLSSKGSKGWLPETGLTGGKATTECRHGCAAERLARTALFEYFWKKYHELHS